MSKVIPFPVNRIKYRRSYYETVGADGLTAYQRRLCAEWRARHV